MKTIATFAKPYEAHLLISRLEGSGIAAYARDENMVTVDWLASTAVGGVKVDVADEDFERAIAAIADTTTDEEKNQTATAPTRVAELDRRFKRDVLRVAVGAIPLGLAGYFIAPEPGFNPNLMPYDPPPMDARPWAATGGALVGGLLANALFNRKKSDQATEPVPPKPDESA